jgi:hypothetical protein
MRLSHYIFFFVGAYVFAEIYDGRKDPLEDQLLRAKAIAAYYEEKALKYEQRFDPPLDESEINLRKLYDAAQIRLRIEEAKLKRIQSSYELDVTVKSKLIEKYRAGIKELRVYIEDFETIHPTDQPVKN